MDSGEMAIESANYLYAVIFAAGAYITYRWFWAEEAEEQKQFNFKPMDSGPLQAVVCSLNFTGAAASPKN